MKRIALLLLALAASQAALAQDTAPETDTVVTEAAPIDSSLSLDASAVSTDTTFLPASQADSVAVRELRQVYATIPAMDGLSVGVRHGVARLSGAVVNLETMEAAIALAEATEGVRFVIDNVEADVKVEARLTPAVQRIRAYWKRFIESLPLIAVALLVFAAFVFLSYLVGKFDNPVLGRRLSPILQNLVRRILRLVIVIVGALLFLDILGITALVGALLGAAGLVGVAVGFAFQDIVENYLAGLLLSLRQPFNLGDLIKITDHEGRVLRLTSRDLLLMTYEGNHVRIPNATVFKSDLVNFTRNPVRRFKVEVGVDVEEQLKTVQEIGVETLRAMRGVLDDPAPFAWVESLGDSNVVVGYYGWVDQTQADFGKVRSEAVRLVKKALDEAGVLMPEPIFNLKLLDVAQALTDAASQAQAGEESSEEPATLPGEPPERAARPTDPQRARDEVHDEARQADVSVDDQLGDQIRRDMAQDDEENLLKDV